LEQPEDKLARAISAVKQGRKAEAERLLKAVVQEAPRNAEGWLWLGAAVSSPGETLYCLERVLEIEPDNQRAQAGIQWAKAQLNRQPLATSHPPSSPSLRVEQALPAQTRIEGATEQDQPGGAHLTSYFFPNLIIAVLALTLLLGLLIIAALLRAWLLP
jgi:thioredoxin-like negative regulator of GroEL